MIDTVPLPEKPVLTGESLTALQEMLVPFKEGTIKLPKGCVFPEHKDHPETTTTTRTAIHRGKKIEVETTYRILIDGEPLRAHVSVLEDGRVHYHGLPNYSFTSALDLARKTIDVFSAPLPKDELNKADHDCGKEGT